MGKTGKKYTAAKARVGSKAYPLPEAMALVRDVKYTKFDESVDIAMLLGVDPKHADQMVRGTVVLPHGTGKSKRVAVIASGDKAKEAQEAGADHVGAEDLVAKITEGFLDFEALVATPDMMRLGGELGQGPGPQGSHAQPEGGHGDDGRGQGGPRNQGRQGRVPRRQDVDHSRLDREDFVRAFPARRERGGIHPGRAEGQAPGRQGEVLPNSLDLLDDGAGSDD